MKNKPLITLTGKIVGVMTVASLGTLAVAHNADAESVLLFSDTASFTNQLTELVGMPELTVSKYTPPAGVPVTEVQIMLMATLNTEGTVFNDTDQTQDFGVLRILNQFDFVPTADSPRLVTLQAFAPNQTLGLQTYTIPSGATAPFGPFTISGMDNQSITGRHISRFLGNGTITYDPVTLIFTTFFGGGIDSNPIDISTFADATLTIKYFTSDIQKDPEPSALLALGVLAGLGFVNQKRASKKS